MPVPPHLLRKFQESLGADAADSLVAWMEEMDTIRGDVKELRHEMQLSFARMETLLEKGLRDQTRFFFVAWSVLLAMMVGLLSRR